jgi:hypothetical protein
MILWHIGSKGVSRPAVIGFLTPLVIAILIAIALHHPAPKTAAPATSSTSQAAAQAHDASVASGAQPTEREVSAAKAAILAYCTSDLRQDTSCTLIGGHDGTAPGFVKTGVRTTGHFEDSGTVNDGEAVAKGGGSNWTVVWVGQGCIPSDIASKNGVPTSLGVCGS